MNNINKIGIPKVIHYCWFGGEEKPEIVKKCITSWSKFLPEWEIKEWNETNYDVNCNDFVKEAYQCRRWAFVSDYARFDILYRYGGIYFDTDVELLKTIPNDVLCNKAFTGIESTKNIAPGLIFGSEKELVFLLKILEQYNNEHYLINGFENQVTVNQRITRLLKNDGFNVDGKFQIIDEIAIYPSEYFCGFDLDVFEPNITEKTISIHHYASSWMTTKHIIRRKFKNFVKRIVGVNNCRKLIMLKRKIKGITD